MNLSQLSAPLRLYFFHVSKTRKYVVSIVLTLLLIISWYFLCYIPSVHYLISKRAHLQQLKQKKAAIEKQLAGLKHIAADLALAKKANDAARERLPVVNKEHVQGIVDALCAKHTLICMKQQFVKHDESYPALFGDIQVISYAYQLQGSYSHFIDLFEDLHADRKIAACCKRLHMKRLNDHLICTCIIDFIGKRES